jgi:PAS domain S-box-containing protein
MSQQVDDPHQPRRSPGEDAAALHRHAVLFNILTEGVLVTDAEGRITDWNRGAERMFGYTREEALGRSPVFFHDPALGSTIERTIMDALKRDGSWSGEIRFRRKDGSAGVAETAVVAQYDEEGRRAAHFGVNREVTARVAAEEQVRFQAQLLDSVGQAVIATDLEGRILYWNRFASSLYGWSAEEVMGRQVYEVISRHTTPPEARKAAERIAADESWMGEYELKRRDGTTFPASVVISPIHDQAGTLVGKVGLSYDLTPRKELEEQLRHAQKMEAVGRLAGGVAHDFNNLLTAIRGNVEMALLELTQSSPLRTELEQVLQAAETAASLTQQLLTFSRRQAHAPRVVELNHLVDNNVRLLQRLLGSAIEIVTSLDPDLWPVRVDPGQVDQLLMNLAVNARDAMPQGGVLRVTTHNHEVSSGRATTHGVTPGRYVALTVSDTGTGMDDATRARIFEPFFTTKELGQGTGLGLSTVYGIVQQSGGFIDVESAPGEGSTFRILLPHVEQTEAAAAPEEAQPAPSGGGETVLLVDDQTPVRILTLRLLQRLGYRVIEARDGVEALEVAARYPSVIHLLLTDLTMPRMGGRELALRLAEQRPGTRVLFMSGYADGGALPDRLGSLATAFIAKPFTLQLLASTIRTLLDGARTP